MKTFLLATGHRAVSLKNKSSFSSFEQMANSIAIIREFKKDSTMTEEDAIRLGRELNVRLAKRRNR